MSLATAQLAERGEGRCAISGALTLETAPWLWQELQKGSLLTTATAADLGEVSDADSAGLALLLAWRASRRQVGGDVHFARIPERLLALARLTQAQSLLEG